MSKRIVHTGDGRRAQRWKFHRGYIVESMSGRFIGWVEPDGQRRWKAYYGFADERLATCRTLDHATRMILDKDSEKKSLAKAIRGAA